MTNAFDKGLSDERDVRRRPIAENCADWAISCQSREAEEANPIVLANPELPGTGSVA